MQNGSDRYSQTGSYRGNPVAREAQRRNMQGNYNPRPAQPRPAQTGTVRRPMNRADYEAMRRRRKRQNMIAFGALAAVLVIVIIAVVLILKPDKPKEDQVVSAISQSVGTQQPDPTAEAADNTAEAPADETPAGEASAEATDADATQNAGGDDSAAIPAATDVPEPVEPPVQQLTGELRSVRMRVVGDIMVTEDQLKYAVKAGYSFDNQFEMISDILNNADYTIGNLETTVGKYGNKAYSGYPLFNSPTQILDTLKTSGFDMLTLANNHMLDRWFDGMKNTVNNVEKWGFDHVGAYRTQEERNTPVVKEIGGIKIGFVAYTHSTNTQEKVCDKDAVTYGVPYLYKSDIAADIKKLRAAGAEVVIAFPHWGDEYIRKPDDNQIAYAKKIAKAGADIIIGSHSHKVQPMGFQTVKQSDGSSKDVFIMFSMGNFISTHTTEYTDSGIILDFTINEQPDGTFTCDNVGYIPTYCWIHDNTVQVLAPSQYLDKAPAGMSNADYNTMMERYYGTIDLIGGEFNVLKR